MNAIEYQWMEPNEVKRISEIDRTETIRRGYRVENGELGQLDVEWDSPAWTLKSDHPHSVQAQIDFCSAHLSSGGRMYGGFVDDHLVGVGILRWGVRPNISQLAFLHVSNGYRRQGIGDKIVRALVSVARTRGDTKIYVSATPSESAVGFYVMHGFRLVAEPIPELFEKEPEDIHMSLDLRADA